MSLLRAAAALALVLLLPVNRGAANEDDDARRIADLEREIRRLRSVEQRVGRQRSGVIEELESISRAIAISDRELEVVRAKLARSQHDAARLEQQLAQAEAGRDRERTSLRAVVRAASERRAPNALAVLLQGSDEPSIERSLLQFERLSAAEAEAVARYEREESRIRAARAQLVREREQHASLAAALTARRTEADAAQARKASALSALDGRTAEATAELRDAARQLRDLVGSFGRESLVAGSEAIHTRFDAQRGQLPWPVRGTIRRRFGLERHPRFNTLIEYQGIEIAAQPGASIRAVHAGRVAFADLFAAYGLLVILDHGDGYYSLYANLADTQVNAGKGVTAGEVLGTLADASVLGADGLRFELHKGAQAFNPEPWLRRP